MDERKKGLAAMLIACVIWGFSPLFYHAMKGVGVGEVLAHRTIWSLVLFLVILFIQRRPRALTDALFGPYLGRIALAALLISANWGIFIWAVQSGHVTESSLGYYVFPLISVVLGVVVLGEKLTMAQSLAVALAALAVIVLTLGLGVAPWISLTLAGTMSIYGLVKKQLPLGPVVSVGAEVALGTPIALLWLIAVHYAWVPTGPAHFGSDAMTTFLLIASGAVTAVPLILFSYASRRINLSTLGLLQYLNPTLQFFCAVVVFGEVFTIWHMIAFALIWTALAIYTVSAMRHRIPARNDVPG